MSTIILKTPVDILACLLYTLFIIPIILLDVNTILRMVLGLPYLLFIPGYLFLLSFAPSHSPRAEIEAIHIFAMSVGLSIALVSLDGILLFYSPIGFSLLSILLSLTLIVVICGLIAIYRRRKLQQQNHFILALPLPTLALKSRLSKLLIGILVCAILLTMFTAIFISFLPTKQESFTEFYILGPSHGTILYPKNLTKAEHSNVTIGLINREHKTVNYYIEIWLVNQTLVYDNITNTMNTTYHEMWFLDKLTTTLPFSEQDPNIIWRPQWEYNYTFSINKTGRYTLMFLLFTSPALEFDTQVNYKDIAATEIQSAYQSLYIWLNINKK